jgi:hypothetical protein
VPPILNRSSGAEEGGGAVPALGATRRAGKPPPRARDVGFGQRERDGYDPTAPGTGSATWATVVDRRAQLQRGAARFKIQFNFQIQTNSN